jgi:hypothetical protein
VEVVQASLGRVVANQQVRRVNREAMEVASPAPASPGPPVNPAPAVARQAADPWAVDHPALALTAQEAQVEARAKGNAERRALVQATDRQDPPEPRNANRSQTQLHVEERGSV